MWQAWAVGLGWGWSWGQRAEGSRRRTVQYWMALGKPVPHLACQRHREVSSAWLELTV